MTNIEALAGGAVARREDRPFERSGIEQVVLSEAFRCNFFRRPATADERDAFHLAAKQAVTKVLHSRNAQDQRLYLSVYRGQGLYRWQRSDSVPLHTLYTIRQEYEARIARLEARRDGIDDRIRALEAARQQDRRLDENVT